MRAIPAARMLLAAVVAAGLGLTGQVPAGGAPTQQAGHDPSQPDVTIARASDGKRFHFPNAERLADGSIVTVAREGADHIGQDGRLVLTRSDDLGSTWTSPTVVIDTPVDDRDPMITQTSSGRLLLSWFQIDWSASPPEPLGTYVVHSDDLGATWSAPAKVHTSLSGESEKVDFYELGFAASHGQIKELDNGELIIPLYGTTPDDRWQRAVVVRSTDGGETWRKQTESLIAAQEGTHFQEPVLTKLRDGTLVALLRIGTGSRISQVSRSHDNGRTWSAPKEIDLPTSSAHTEVLSNGDVFLAYGDLSARFTPRRATVGAVIRHPERPWTGLPRELVYDSGVGDQANPAAVEVAPGRVLVIGFDVRARTLVGTFVDPNNIRPDPPDRRRADLLSWHAQDRLKVDTDMTYTDDTHESLGPLGAIDGEVGYWTAAAAPHDAPASYALTLDDAMLVQQVGVALKPGYAEAATIQVRDGRDWRTVGRLPRQVRYGELVWFDIHDRVTGVRVRIEGSEGWAVLSELALRVPPGQG